MKNDIIKLEMYDYQYDNLITLLNHYNDIYDPMEDEPSPLTYNQVMEIFNILFDREN